MLRILLIPVFVLLFFLEFQFHRVAATIVFAIASFTDFLDGYLARKNNMVTNLGKFLDPIADKMLVACALFAVVIFVTKYAFLQIGAVVCSMIIICRELMVSGFRIIASSKNVILAADKLGKIKTVFQLIALILLLPVGDIYVHISELTGDIFLYAGSALLALATVMTIVSGINYVVKNAQVLKD